jgi:dipeptidyl aminopeptidase/acylaminoacyl peptidase
MIESKVRRMSGFVAFAAAVLVSLENARAAGQALEPPSAAPCSKSTVVRVVQRTSPQTTTGAQSEKDALAPVVAVQQEDYARARSQFRTKLLRKVSAPQPWSPTKVPSGVSEVEYPSGELRLRAWMSRPSGGAGKHPAVLFLHGGFAFDRDDWELAQPFRTAGFVLMAPILRAENGQAGAFTLWYDEVDDVLAAAEFLSVQPDVDSEHLYLAGSSAGGTLTLLTAMTTHRFRAAASFSASPDQALLVKHAKIDLPFDKTNPRELQVRSPLAYAGSLKCPTRIYYATQDHFVLTSQRMAEVAKQRGLDVEAVRMEGDHGSIVPPSIARCIKFFDAH